MNEKLKETINSIVFDFKLKNKECFQCDYSVFGITEIESIQDHMFLSIINQINISLTLLDEPILYLVEIQQPTKQIYLHFDPDYKEFDTEVILSKYIEYDEIEPFDFDKQYFEINKNHLLQEKLDEAVNDENYELAIKIRDQINSN